MWVQFCGERPVQWSLLRNQVWQSWILTPQLTSSPLPLELLHEKEEKTITKKEIIPRISNVKTHVHIYHSFLILVSLTRVLNSSSPEGTGAFHIVNITIDNTAAAATPAMSTYKHTDINTLTDIKSHWQTNKYTHRHALFLTNPRMQTKPTSSYGFPALMLNLKSYQVFLIRAIRWDGSGPFTDNITTKVNKSRPLTTRCPIFGDGGQHLERKHHGPGWPHRDSNVSTHTAETRTLTTHHNHDNRCLGLRKGLWEYFSDSKVY